MFTVFICLMTSCLNIIDIWISSLGKKKVLPFTKPESCIRMIKVVFRKH